MTPAGGKSSPRSSLQPGRRPGYQASGFHSQVSRQNIQKREVGRLRDELDPGLLPNRLIQDGANAGECRVVEFEAEHPIVALKEDA